MRKGDGWIPSKYPSLTGYLESLPAGLESYPECESKASLVASLLDHDLSAAVADLPDELGALIREPPPATMWLPAVHADAFFHLVCDLYYPSDQSMLEWTARRTRATASGQMYRRLLRVAGPHLFIRMGVKMHRLFQRGTELDVEMEHKKARLVLRFPPHLHSRKNLLSNVPVWSVVIEMTGGKAPEVEMVGATSTRAVYMCSWT